VARFRAALGPGSHEEILRFFDGLDLAEPGLVRVQEWRPRPGDPPDGGQDWLLAAVGRVPAPAPA
jgi:S-adenosyl methyltransferase